MTFTLRRPRYRKGGRAKITTTLPTSVPGISFTAKGSIQFRRAAGLDEPPPSRRIARAAAVTSAIQRSSTTTVSLSPEAVCEAEQRVALELCQWQAAEGFASVQFTGQFAISLAPADTVRAARFADARQQAAVSEALAQDRVEHLRSEVFNDLVTAQLWWFQLALERGQPEFTVKMFDELVRPLVAASEKQEDAAARFAAIVTTLVDRTENNSTRLTTLAQLVDATLARMEWSADQADKLTLLLSEKSARLEGNDNSSVTPD